jgi:very-short-patch-repair endonuclease
MRRERIFGSRKARAPGAAVREVDLVLSAHLRELGLGDFARELTFSAERRWRFDYAIERLKIAIEIEGGLFTGGRHTRGLGFQDDCDKYNAAAALGWRVFRFSVEDVLKGRDIPVMTAALAQKHAVELSARPGTDEPPKMACASAAAARGERTDRHPSSYIAVARELLV